MADECLKAEGDVELGEGPVSVGTVEWDYRGVHGKSL